MYCLTKNGELGKFVEELEGKLVLYKLNKKGEILYEGVCIVTLKVNKDEVYSTSNSIDFLNSQRDSLIDFSNFINISFDIQGILYDFFNNSDFYARREKISEYLNKIGLSLIYLYNLDQYIVVDKKSTGKSITIKTPSIEIKHLIGKKGNNINRIKREYNFKNISVKSIEVEEYQTLYKEFRRNLLFLVNQ